MWHQQASHTEIFTTDPPKLRSLWKRKILCPDDVRCRSAKGYNIICKFTQTSRSNKLPRTRLLHLPSSPASHPLLTPGQRRASPLAVLSLSKAGLGTEGRGLKSQMPQRLQEQALLTSRANPAGEEREKARVAEGINRRNIQACRRRSTQRQSFPGKS